jgi:cytochrome c oxidase subunit 2
VLACPVCFGQNDSPLALGINYGILAMLGFIGSLLLAFASFFTIHATGSPRRREAEAQRGRAGASRLAKPSAWPCVSRAGRNDLMQELLGLPPAASSHAGDIDQMISWHWLMAGFCRLNLLRVRPVRFRSGANPRRTTPAPGEALEGHRGGHRRGRNGVAVGYAIPAWAKRVQQFLTESKATSSAWWASTRLEHSVSRCRRQVRPSAVALGAAGNPLGLDRNDPDGKDDITTINQLNLPVDRPVLVHLSSKDVIHSFSLYEMRVKQDAIPGLQIPVWFIPTVTTAEMRQKIGKADFDYEIACSQLCGLGHFRMRGFMTIQSAADYQKWMADQVKEKAGN